MAVRVVVHLHNEDPFMADMDEMPNPGDNFVVVTNPRRRDGKALTFITEDATSFIYPWTRITFIEVLDGATSQGKVIGFFREESRSVRG